MVTLGQKLKMQKNMLKTFLQDIAVALCKKQLQITAISKFLAHDNDFPAF